MIGCSSNSEADVIDLTADITGDYVGAFSSSLEEFEELEITIVKVDDETIEIQLGEASGLDVTVSLMSASETLITNQPNQQFGVTASFNLTMPTTLDFNIDPAGFNGVFSGTKL